jgi:Skp family chaperone for outer membrane proteins
MNKIQIVINVILVAAVATLFGIVLAGKKPASAEVAVSTPSEVMPVAYLNVDSLLANYTFAQEASEKLMTKQEDARVKMNTKLRTFQNEVADFQRKLENNGFLSRERAEQAQQKLAKKEQELQELEAKLTQDIMIENQKLNVQLADSLTNYLKEFNADRLISSFELITVKFSSINYDVSEKNIYKLVYEKSMYCLTYENIQNMLAHIHGIQDVAIVKHKNYAALLSIIDSPIYSYVKANIAEYFEIIFKECDGKIEDDEMTILNVLNDESITDEVKKHYISLLSNFVSDISQVNDHKLWSVLLEQRKLHFGENNLYYCFAEYKSLTALLIGYINRYSGIIDISNISVETDEQFKRKIFDATIKCYELSDAKYGQILSSTTIVCDTSFDIDNVPTSKMNVLIDNGIIRMSKGCLNSIRNKYKDVLFRFVKVNIVDYVDIMNASLFAFSELIEILNWPIEDDIKLTLLGFTNEKISVVDKKYSDRVLAYILTNHFLIEDLLPLLRQYNYYSLDIRHIIFDLAIRNIYRVINAPSDLSDTVCREFFSTERLNDDEKINLFTALISTISRERVEEYALILNRKDLASALDPIKRTKLLCNSQNKKILDEYKDRGWIRDYAINQNNTHYNVRKVNSVVNRTVEDI